MWDEMKDKRRELMWCCYRTAAPTTGSEGGDGWCSPAEGTEMALDFGEWGIPHFLSVLRISVSIKAEHYTFFVTYFVTPPPPKDQGNNKENMDVRLNLKQEGKQYKSGFDKELEEVTVY